MSDSTEQNLDDLFDDDTAGETQAQGEQAPDGPKALREAYKREKAEREKAERELKELRDKQRQAELEGKLEAAGIPKGFVEDALRADDPDAWIESRRTLINGGGGNEPEGDSALPEDQRAQMQAVQSVQPGVAPLGDDQLASQVQSAASSAKSREEFYAELEKMGALGSVR